MTHDEFQSKLSELRVEADNAVQAIRDEAKESTCLQEVLTAKEGTVKGAFSDAVDRLVAGYVQSIVDGVEDVDDGVQ